MAKPERSERSRSALPLRQLNRFCYLIDSDMVFGTDRLIATCRSTTDRNTPRLRRRRVSLEKKPSTALSQDAEVGVKWNVQRGCRTSHWRTFGCLWVA